MGSGLDFPISAISFSLLVIILFYSKKPIKTIETKIYKYLLLSNFAGLIIEILCTYASYISTTNPFLSDLILKLYLVYNIGWTLLLLIYVFYVSFTEKYIMLGNKLKAVSLGVFVFCTLITYILRCDLVIQDNFRIRYTEGPSVNFTYTICGILIFAIILMILKNRKSIKSKKYIPVYIFIVTLIIGIIIQKSMPGLLIMTYIETLTVSIMYHTIENPDVKMLNELYKNKELMEQNYEDKYNFLFEMTQEARNPLVNINNLSNALRMEDDKNKIKEGLLTMSNLVRQLDFSINDILNISSLDVQKIKVVNNKYELEKLCNDLEVRVKPEVSDGVKFTLTTPKQLPILYGDYMKIRQILYSLLINSCKNTTTGHINMNVNLIEKYDVARLIFNISDTGRGMSIEQINDILSSTGTLEKQELENLEKKEYNVKLCQKVVKLMGGNLMIKSNIGEGTDVILTVDQKVFHEKDKNLLIRYENDIASYRKVLIVSQNKDVLNVIKKKLSYNNITYSSLYYGADAIDRVKSGKKFDFILVDDEMAEMSGFMTLKGMKDVKGFNMPVIIMLKEDKEHIKEHYLDDGFKDYILLDNLDGELDRIINKY